MIWVAIFAGVNGYTDDIPLDELKRFEKELLQSLEKEHKDILDKIEKDKEIKDETRKELSQIIEAFKQSFTVEKK